MIAAATPASPTTTDARSVPVLCLTLLLIAVFLMGGGARDDIQSLLVLRPLGAMLFVGAVIYLLPRLWAEYRFIMMLVVAVLGLLLLHLIPLPPALWTALPGREPIVAVYTAADMALPWLPLSIAPETTWNALFAVTVPIAALMFALTARHADLVTLLRLVLIIGIASGMIGLLQAIGPERSLLYLYRITNHGSAVGLFANRNHQALFLACLFPLFALHLSMISGTIDQQRGQRWVVFAAAALLVPLILVTGSRAGLIAGVGGLAAAFWVYRTPTSQRRVVRSEGVGLRDKLLVMTAIVALGLITFATSRATALQRLFDSSSGDGLRLQALPTLLDSTLSFLPFGSGIGSFVEAYQIVEPDALLSPNYFNHAHNDALEIALTGGLPGIAIMLAVLGLFVAAGMQLIRAGKSNGTLAQPLVLGRAGFSILAILMFGSIGDYPLRTPALSVLAAIAVAGVALSWRAMAERSIATMPLRRAPSSPTSK